MGWTKTNDPLEPKGLEPLESALYGDRSQLLAEERAVLLGALLNSLVFPLPDSCMHLTARALWGTRSCGHTLPLSPMEGRERVDKSVLRQEAHVPLEKGTWSSVTRLLPCSQGPGCIPEW